jgi:hypothetical protein
MGHFEEGDPLKRSTDIADLTTGSPSKSTSTHRSSGRDSDFLPSNLETRRRRRDCANPRTATSDQTQLAEEKLPSITKPAEPALSQPLKTGAKRKFASSDVEPKPLLKSTSQRDLGSSRRRDSEDTTSRPLSRSKSHVNLASIASSMNKQNPRSSANLQNRKALGESESIRV